MTALMKYSWPGNVRELEHAIERAVIVASGTAIRRSRIAAGSLAEDSPARFRRQPRSSGTGTRMIERALERFRGNRREAAEALKISTVTLWRKMKQYGLVK